MSKPKSVPVPGNEPGGSDGGHRERNGANPKPLSGSKKTKQKNHVDHNNPEG
ncbi:spore protein [Paenibacillus oryzae]|uniref:Spore protein n=1 Tax=Paenibacillus oryzae TaxID=1844972 RepID=A0A1A5YMG1_9BACL|nr:small acid-soluble spore protein P [Paenibacillus oryzae]OBR66728.1 spore protein [Paenibacillus oryzae]